MFCPEHKKFVHGEHIVNGYETDKGGYVIVRENEYKALEPKRSQSIEIDCFINYGDIDPIYFDRPYYILPRKGGAKAYQMLNQVLKKTGKAGIASFVLHTREHLVAVKAGEKVLELLMLHYSDEIRSSDEISPTVEAQSAKVKSIIREINKIAGKYEPEKYIDEHRRQILEFLKEKAEQGQTVTIEAEEEIEELEGEGEPDLVAALEESLSRLKSKS
jgi:DNA end-binding protein Ku